MLATGKQGIYKWKCVSDFPKHLPQQKNNDISSCRTTAVPAILNQRNVISGQVALTIDTSLTGPDPFRYCASALAQYWKGSGPARLHRHTKELVLRVSMLKYTVWLEILAGNLFWRIGGFESNPPIFHPPKTS